MPDPCPPTMVHNQFNNFFSPTIKDPSQVHQSEEDEQCVPAECSSSSTSSTTTFANISTPIAQTTPQTLFLTTTSAAPMDCLSILTTALSERQAEIPEPSPHDFRRTEIQKTIEEGLTLGGIQAQGVLYSRVQNELLFLGTLRRQLEEVHWERRRKGLLGVQVDIF